MTLIDGLVAISVVTIFFYVIAQRMKAKYPKIGEPFANMFQGGLVKEDSLNNKKEVSQQIWTEKAATM